MEIDGGTPHSLPIGNLSVREGGASWAADGTILFASDDGIFKFDRSEAVPQQVTSINRSLKEEAHLYPKFLVDNHRFLYTVTGSDEASPSIYIASIDGSTPQFVVEGSGAIYLSGYLLYVQDGRLLVCACDQNSMKPSAEPIEIASGISISDTRGPAFSAAASGLVVYSTSGLRQRVQLTEYDRLGATLRMIGDPDRYSNPALSPDQKSLLCSVEGESSMQRGNIYRLQLDSGNRSRFTYGGCENDPVWSPDGTQFAYSSLCEGDYGIYIMDAMPGGKAKKLFESDVIVYPTDWAKDERFLLYTRVDPKTGRDLWIWSFLDEKESSLVKTQGIDDMGVFSPDGDWIAYSSEETGRSEIYIRPRGHSDFKLQVTSEGGRQPRWGPDGEELFFASADGTALYSSLIKYNPSPEKSTPRKLFDVNLSEISQSQWVVTKDGQRFIVQTLKEENIDRLKAISNWLDLVR